MKKIMLIAGIAIIALLIFGGAFLFCVQNKSSSATNKGEWVLNDNLLRRVMIAEAGSTLQLANNLAAYEPPTETFDDTSGIIKKSVADTLKYGIRSIIVYDVGGSGNNTESVMNEIARYYMTEGYKLLGERAMGRTQVEVKGIEINNGEIHRIFIAKGDYLIEYKTQGTIYSAESTPVRTFNWNLVWIILAIAVIIAGFIFLRKKGIIIKMPKAKPRTAKKK